MAPPVPVQGLVLSNVRITTHARFAMNHILLQSSLSSMHHVAMWHVRLVAFDGKKRKALELVLSAGVPY